MTARRETIVVGVDGSACSLAALRWAVDEAKLRNAGLRVVHAWSYPHVSTYHEAAHVMRLPLAESAEALVERVVDQVTEKAGDVEVASEVVESPAAEALIEAAADASLLVVGSRGLGGFRGLLLGSVSQQCAHHAPCPVVIVHEPGA